MQIKIPDLKKYLKKNIKPIYILFSNEHILLKKIIKKIKKFYKKKNYKKKYIFIIDKKFQWEKLFLINNFQTLFEKKKIIELIFIEEKINNKYYCLLKKLVSNININNLFIISFPKLTLKEQKNKDLIYLKNKYSYINISNIKKKKFQKWVKNNFKNQKQIINNKTVEYFSKKINFNLLFANQEIKNFFFIYKSGKISFEDVKNFFSNKKIFINKLKFNKVFITANIIKIIKTIFFLKKKKISILIILWDLLKEIRILIKYKIEKLNFKKNIFIKKKYKLILNKVKLINLKKTILEIFKIEKIIKGIKIKNFYTNPWEAIILLIINLIK
ncbi:DNA polymerase III subunit delta [Candidatus Zinderia endosymbiont of Aphrophora alni]|uniref:DNA polymerase III subunit delta n=1 Tax=Candidatus Zinderia endosymbiont of Aphrophora alni TaxID=3077951 RepID=UPI0030CA889E